MPSVSVSYLGMIQRVVGKRREQVELNDPATVGDLVDRLTEQYGQDFRERILDGNNVGRLVTILIDGENCLSLGGLAAPLGQARQIEVVLLGPPPAGG